MKSTALPAAARVEFRVADLLLFLLPQQSVFHLLYRITRHTRVHAPRINNFQKYETKVLFFNSLFVEFCFALFRMLISPRQSL